MQLIVIILATLVAGVGSVWVAAALSAGPLARRTDHLLSLAAGALLATAFVNLVPEAFESQVPAEHLSWTLLAGLLVFFMLDKAQLWHHGHMHHHETPHDHHAHLHAASHAHAYDHSTRGATLPTAPASPSGSWVVLAGDAMHCFGDGVLIAAAFVADQHLGVAAALAVLVHEVPHHMGDLAVVRSGGRHAAWKVSAAGAFTVLGGVLGYAIAGVFDAFIPQLLMLAASSFIYVALADLIPQLQRKTSLGHAAQQVLCIALGMALIVLASHLGAPHSHTHTH